jgi:hypothetical protein
MKSLAIASTFVLSTLALASMPRDAQALTCSTSGDCYSVTQSGSGRAILALAGSGTAISSQSWSGTGLHALSVQHDAFEAVAQVAGRSAVYARNIVANGGYGVYATANGNGHAIHGVNTSSSGYAGYFDGKVFATTYQGSDARLKKNIKTASYGLTQLLELRPVTFEWKADNGQPGIQLGLIAQEVQKIVPEVVTRDGQNGMLAVNYTALLPIVIKGVQEQQTVLREQEQRIKQQEDRIAALERGRKPAMASMFSGVLGPCLMFGLLGFGLSAAVLRRRDRAV